MARALLRGLLLQGVGRASGMWCARGWSYESGYVGAWECACVSACMVMPVA